MYSPLALFRLVNRPLVWLGWAWVTWMFVMTSLSSPGQTTAPPFAMWADPAGPLFWRLVIGIPAATGLVISFVRVDLLKGSFPWLLPGLTIRMNLALAIAGISVSLPMSVMAIAAGHFTVAAAALGVGLLSFATASVFMETFWSVAMVAIAIALGAGWYQAPRLIPVAFEHPLVLGALTLALAAWVQRSQHGRDGVRSLLEFLRVPQDPPILRFLQRDTTRAADAVSLHAAGNLAWARATLLESPFGRGPRLVWTFGLFVGIQWLLMPDGAATFMAGLWFSMACIFFPLGLRRDQSYPISRRRRAAVAWLAAAMTAALFWIMIVGWTIAFESLAGSLRTSPVLTIPGRERTAAFSLVWYPVLLWPSIRHGLSVSNWQKHMPRSPLATILWMGGAMLAFFILVESTSRLIGRVPSMAWQVVSALLVAAAVQLAFYAALRRYFTTGDLR